MNPLRSLRSRLDGLYSRESYLVRMQAQTLFYLTLFLSIALPVLALCYAVLLPLRAPIAVPPLLTISGVTVAAFAFLMVGRFRWAGPVLSYVIAFVLMAAQLPKRYAILPRVEVVAQTTAVQIGRGARSVDLVLSTGILYLLRRLFDLALDRMSEANRSISRFVPAMASSTNTSATGSWLCSGTRKKP